MALENGGAHDEACCQGLPRVKREDSSVKKNREEGSVHGSRVLSTGVRVVIAGFYGSETKREKLGYLFEMKGKRLLSLFIFDREERTVAARFWFSFSMTRKGGEGLVCSWRSCCPSG